MTSKELYEFKDDENSWYFTSADSDEAYLGNLYLSSTIGRTDFETRNELSRASIEVSFNLDNETARYWLDHYYETVTTLTIYEKSDVETLVIWKGRMVSVKPSKNNITLQFENVFTSLRRSGVSDRFQKTCRYTVYQRGCRLNKDDFAFKGTVLAVDDGAFVFNIPEAAEKEDSYFTGGMLQGVDGYFRFIISHVGSTIVLQQSYDSLREVFLTDGYGNNYGNYYGDIGLINLYPGCDKVRNTCLNKFNNLDNYGGFPFIPSKNPMSGSSIM